MPRPRWRKILADVRTERGRLAAMVIAIAISTAALGAVLGAWSILTHGMRANYLGTRPADATLVVPGGIDDALLAAVRAEPSVAEADRREVVLARVHVGDDWRPLLLFLIDDFADVRLNRVRPTRGAWPPPEGTVLIERSATTMAQADLGDALEVQLPGGTARSLRISGEVHDPGLAPAWQERSVYAYASRATVTPTAPLHELRVTFVGATDADATAIAAKAEQLAAWMLARGHEVHELRIPPPRQHPHERQMATVLALLLALAGFALGLGSVLVATSLAAMLARQVREIGVLKTLGARRHQLIAMYLVLVGGIGTAAFAVAAPIATLGAHAISTKVAALLNFDLVEPTIPGWVYAALATAAIATPIAFASVPVLGAARMSIRSALDRHGASSPPRRRGPSRWQWPAVVRSALRRRARAAFTIGLLAAAGAMFMTSLAVSRAWERNLEEMHRTRHYDLEVRFASDPSDAMVAIVAQTEGVRALERVGYAPAAFGRAGHVDVVRTYPDRGHGSLTVLAHDPLTTMITFPVLAGRWLVADDDDAVVLNHVAAAQSGARPGDAVVLSFDGVQAARTVVGVVEEIGAAGVVYVTPASFAAARGSTGVRMLRVVTTAQTAAAREAIVREIDARLRHAGADLELVLPFSELRTAVGDHVVILVQLLVAAAVVLAVVGLVGLGTAMGTSVVERTREIAVLKTLGARRRTLSRMIVGEALLLAALSWLAAVVLSLPLTWGLEVVVGRLGFLAPLPFVVSPLAMGLWAVAIAIGAALAAAIPARRAARLTVLEGLAET